jgi:hypothetical protein
MTIRERLLPKFQRLRENVIDRRAGLRRYVVYTRSVTPSDGVFGLSATLTVVDTLLQEKPRVRRASQYDEIRSGGMVKVGDFLLDRITPRNDGDSVGTKISDIYLKPDPSKPGQKVFVVLVGPDMPAYVAADPLHVPPIQASGGGLFTPVYADASQNFGFSLAIRPVTGLR